MFGKDRKAIPAEWPGPADLAAYLFRENTFPFGAFLMTGTGIVPPDDFTLAPGDRVRITIDPIGTLENDVVQGRLAPAD